MSSSADARIIIKEEAVYNTPPGGAYTAIRHTGESFTAEVLTTESAEIGGTTRMVSDSIPTGLSVSGGFDYELSEDTFDFLLKGAYASDLDTTNPGYHSYKLGKEKFSYSIEKQYNDISKMVLFSGMRVNTFSLSAEYGSPVTGSFDFAGANVNASPAASDAATVSPSTTTNVFNACADFANLLIDGVASTAIISSLNFEISQNLSAVNGLGFCGARDQRLGSKAGVTGGITASLDADTYLWYLNAIDNTEMSVEFTLQGPTKSYTFIFPVVKSASNAPPIEGDDIEIELDFTGIRTPIELRVTQGTLQSVADNPTNLVLTVSYSGVPPASTTQTIQLVDQSRTIVVSGLTGSAPTSVTDTSNIAILAHITGNSESFTIDSILSDIWGTLEISYS